MISSGINLVMTVIGFAVSTLFIVFVCTRLICARIQLRSSLRAFPDASRSDFNVLERGIHGLEPVVVSSFPTKKYGDQLFSSEEDIQCTVCLAEYQEKDILRVLPFCGHTFHVACIDIWLKQYSTCPVCRISLRDSPERKRVMQPVYSPAIRSNPPQENIISDPCQYQSSFTGYSQRLPECRQTVNNEEDMFISEPSGARVTDGSWSDVTPVENYSSYQGKGKHLESPSYS